MPFVTNMDGLWEHYAKWSELDKSDGKRNILWFIYVESKRKIEKNISSLKIQRMNWRLSEMQVEEWEKNEWRDER